MDKYEVLGAHAGVCLAQVFAPYGGSPSYIGILRQPCRTPGLSISRASERLPPGASPRRPASCSPSSSSPPASPKTLNPKSAARIQETRDSQISCLSSMTSSAPFPTFLIVGKVGVRAQTLLKRSAYHPEMPTYLSLLPSSYVATCIPQLDRVYAPSKIYVRSSQTRIGRWVYVKSFGLERV